MAKTNNKRKVNGNLLLIILFVCIVAVLIVAAIKDTSSRNEEASKNSDTADLTLSETDAGTTDAIPSDRTSDTPPTDTATESSSAPTTDTTTDTPSTSTNTNTNTEPQIGTEHNHQSANDTASFDKDNWYMLLANPTHPLPDGFTFQQASVYSAGRNWTFDYRCAEDMKAMLAAAKTDGVDLIICSAYRNIQTQTNNFNAKVQEYMNLGYSKEEATKVTATIIAVPGTSEHHTGLAADIVTPSYQRLNAGFAKTDAFKWLKAHCAEFGFVLRYPEDKTDVTKIIYEPWHYRYVGKEAATVMMNEGICFEEFLEKYGT